MKSNQKNKDKNQDYKKKEYIVITNEKEKRISNTSYYLPRFVELNFVVSEKIFFMNNDEIINYVNKYGKDNIKCIVKNEEYEIESIINIKKKEGIENE